MGNAAVSSAHLQRVLSFIEMDDNIPSSPYFSGSVQLKEENTFMFTAAGAGAGGGGLQVQIGIPPETIKTSMRQGKCPPQVYVLPPKLMRGYEHVSLSYSA